MPYVVVIDDNAINCELLAAVLEGRGYDVQLAASGEAGISLVRQTNPDAVISDMRMPGMNGRQVIQMLKADSSTQHIPVIIATGELNTDGIGDAWIKKPINADELLAILRRLIPRAAEEKVGARGGN
jgi:CheY-like chemotaxis protein